MTVKTFTFFLNFYPNYLPKFLSKSHSFFNFFDRDWFLQSLTIDQILQTCQQTRYIASTLAREVEQIMESR